METVKVDIQKLQLLNDRINQTIDALAQLRQTVHAYTPPMAGLQHSMGAQQFGPQFGQQFGPQFGQQFGQGFGQGYGIGSPAMYSPVGQQGLQHTVPQYGSTPGFGYNVGAQVNPYAQSAQLGQANPYAQSAQWGQGAPYGQSFAPTAPVGWWNPMGGLSHTGFVPRPDISRLDPTTAMWIAQQFPYAFSATPPVL